MADPNATFSVLLVSRSLEAFRNGTLDEDSFKTLVSKCVSDCTTAESPESVALRGTIELLLSAVRWPHLQWR